MVRISSARVDGRTEGTELPVGDDGKMRRRGVISRAGPARSPVPTEVPVSAGTFGGIDFSLASGSTDGSAEASAVLDTRIEIGDGSPVRANVNAIDDEGLTPLDRFGDEETAALLYKHGAKRAIDLKAEGK